MLQGPKRKETNSQREQLATLQRVAASYAAKVGTQQEEVDRLENIVTVCEFKIAEAKRELAQATGAEDGSIKADKARLQIEDRLTVMQQRLNSTLATNAQLHSDIEERRRQVWPPYHSACSLTVHALRRCHVLQATILTLIQIACFLSFQ